MFAVVVVVSVVCAFAVVVVCAALIFQISTALIVQMLRFRPMHGAGLLGGLLVRSLAVTVIPVVWLALMVVGPLTRLTAVIAVVAVAPPAVFAPSAVR